MSVSQSRPMMRVSLRNIAAHKLRLVLSVLAVVLGTAFVTGSLVFTSTLKSTFDRLLDDGTQDLSAMIEPEDPRGAGVPFEVVDRARALPGVEAAEPGVSGTVVLFNADGTPYQTGGAPSEGLEWIDDVDSVGSSGWITQGRAPAADGEVVLPEMVVADAGLVLGEPAQVYTTADGMLDVTVVGSYESDSDVGGYVGVGFTTERARALFTDGENVREDRCRPRRG